jgi:hypothetical protein
LAVSCRIFWAGAPEDNAMSHDTVGLERAEETILNFEVCDAVLETAARPGQVKAAYTVPSSIICIPLVPQKAAR